MRAEISTVNTDNLGPKTLVTGYKRFSLRSAEKQRNMRLVNYT